MFYVFESAFVFTEFDLLAVTFALCLHLFVAIFALFESAMFADDGFTLKLLNFLISNTNAIPSQVHLQMFL